jgi:hypothetical protein
MTDYEEFKKMLEEFEDKQKEFSILFVKELKKYTESFNRSLREFSQLIVQATQFSTLPDLKPIIDKIDEIDARLHKLDGKVD